MAYHPLNLALRFLLELVALLAIGYWGWANFGGGLRIVAAIGLPLIAAVLWATFAVPGDRSRSGKAPVPVPGVVRLGLELALFAVAVWALYAAGQTTLGLILAVVVIIHYLLSVDRISWLVKQ